MWYTYIFNTEIDEEPYYCNGDICYRNIEADNCIKVFMDINNNINFSKGIIGYGFDTDNIKGYKDLLKFLKEHYNEIEEPSIEPFDSCGITRHDCIDELIEVCKEHII